MTGRLRIGVLSLLACLLAFGEYQVHRYRSSFRVPYPVAGVGWCRVPYSHSLRHVSLHGYLVVACCYPCGSSFGKGYENWLYVERVGDRSRTVWRIPVKCDGGLFGRGVDMELVKGMDLYFLGEEGRRYLTRAAQSWIRIELSSVTQVPASPLPAGVLGEGIRSGVLTHCGTGTGSWKLNPELAPHVDFNPYIRSAHGSVTGMVDTGVGSSFSPSNLWVQREFPVSGVFSTYYDHGMTKRIAGHADWRDIDRLILERMRNGRVVSDGPDESLWW